MIAARSSPGPATYASTKVRLSFRALLIVDSSA
jgi:hypothetical protein